MRIQIFVIALAVVFLTTIVAPRAQADTLLVTTQDSNHLVLRYDGDTGAFIDVFAEHPVGPIATHVMAFGLDGNLYVSSPNQILRFNGATGEFIDVFASGVGFVQGMVFGLDGNLYTTLGLPGRVARYDGKTGAPMGTFTPLIPTYRVFTRLAFGVDGNLYVGTGGCLYIQPACGEILRYNGTTGAPMGSLVTSGSGGLDSVGGFVFGADGNLYVASVITNQILRYNGTTGAFIDVFASTGLRSPIDLVFGHDGNLYVSDQTAHSVLRYNGQTGAFMGAFVPPRSGGLLGPQSLLFKPTIIPEPTTPTLLLIGLVGLVFAHRLLRAMRTVT